MTRMAEFKINATFYEGRKWSPIFPYNWDVTQNMTKDVVGVGQEGLIVLPFFCDLPLGSHVNITVSAQPHSLTNLIQPRIKSITESEGDFTHNAMYGQDGQIAAVVIAEGTQPPRGEIGIFQGRQYFVNVANAPGMAPGTLGDVRVTANSTIKG